QLPGGVSSRLLDTSLNISSFGEDEAGELYVVGLGGTVHRIVSDVACSFGLSSTSRSVPVGGVQGATVDVAGPVGCGWTAASNDAWITVTSGRAGSGNGQVVFSVAANFGSTAARSGTLTIAGRTFTVIEAGCTYALSPTSRSVPVSGAQSAAASVTAPAGCP